MSERIRVLALEPYYGGSHRAVLDLLVAHVDAEWTLVTLPARKWKWRMRGAAITMAEQVRALVAESGARAPYDVVFASTFLNLAEWRGLVGPALARVPAIVYFHENQLLYPNRHTAEWDLQFPLTNVTTALSAECCVFNTAWNLEGFLSEIPVFMRGFPDHRPAGLEEVIRAKSTVLAPPFDERVFARAPLVRGDRVRLVWPHRWEHDKGPEEFLAAVGALAAEGLDFEVAIAGQSFRETEEAIASAARSLGPRLVHCGQPEGRSAYAALLSSSDVAVSTAQNEFFGLAMVEACAAGCMPLVPERLAYPEIYPASFRYDGFDDLVSRLRAHITCRPAPGAARSLAGRFSIECLAPCYSALLERTASPG